MTIARIGPERAGELEAPYRALHRQHAEVAPTLAGMPARSEAESWASRLGKYAVWLAEPGAFALLASGGDRAIGFAVVTVSGGYDGWEGPERLGEVRDIAVVPESRGRGVGSRLLETAAAELAGAGVPRYRLTVLSANRDAIRFYERHGLQVVSQQMLSG